VSADSAKAGRELAQILGDAALETWRSPLTGRELPLAVPADEEELCAVLRLAGRRHLAVLPFGGGSKLGWCRPPERLDLVLSTRRLRGISSCEPEEGTLTARAGTPMADLEAAARQAGHALSPDVPDAGTATLGGVLSAGQSGADRLGRGPVRDRILGMRVALADGSTARSGGTLVKNATGYDLHKLYCGAHGSLCVVTEAALRLAPLAQEDVWVESEELDAIRACQKAGRVRRLPLRCRTLAATDRLGGGAEPAWRLGVHLAGRPEVLQQELTELRELLPEARVLEGGDARARAAEWRELEHPEDRWPELHLALRPSRLVEIVERLRMEAREAGLSAGFAVHPAIATLSVFLDGAGADDDWREDPRRRERLAVLVESLRAELEPGGGRAFLRGVPPALLERLDPFGGPSPALALMRRLKDALDPMGVLAPGRFHGGL